MARQLKIIEWNANGLLHHKQELQVVLETEKIDVCLIAETHFTRESYIKFRGYKFYHTIHPENTAKGGSAVIIKESILHYQETGYQSEEIQATTVHVKTKTYGVNITAIYCPPKHAIKKEQYVDFLEKQGHRFVVGGDFNAKHTHWGSRLITTKGKQLLESCSQLKCVTISTGKPTYWPTDLNKIPDLIDFFITRNIASNYINIEEAWDMNSDHSPILLTLSDRVISKEVSPRLVNKLTDWQSFKLKLEESIELSVPLITEEQLEMEAELFNKHIQAAAWENTPTISRTVKSNNYPKEIRDLISEKRKLRRKWQLTRAPTDKTALNNAAQHLKRVIQRIKNESMDEYLRDLSNDSKTDYSLWKTTKRLKRPTLQNPPLKNADGTWARSNSQKAYRFAQHLEAIFQPNEGENHDTWATPIQEEVEIRPTTPKEVFDEIKTSINPKKAPGFDLITGEILKQLPRKAIVKLANLINASFRLKYVPRIWKVAEIMMIPKPGKPSYEVSSYRPISLLPVVSKLHEKLFLKRLKVIIEQKELIPPHQFGFRESHSTIDQVHRITNIIEKSLEKREVCSTVFLDVAQAFDRVWHEGLYHKLQVLLPRQHSQLLVSYLSERHFRIKHEQAYSDLKEIKAGVPQGSVLGPILYLLYTSDIPVLEHETIATFADDTAVIAVGKNHEDAAEKLQASIDKINTWTKAWRIKLNETKSVHIDFTNRPKKHLPIRINDSQIPHADVAKYLGIHLDARLRWKVHVKKKNEELNIKLRKMYWLLGRSSELSTHNKLILYKQILKPVWTYGIELWGCASKTNIAIIQRFQNKVLRDIVDAPWYFRNCNLHKDLGVDTVEQTIRQFARNHERRLHQHVNVEAIQLLDNTQLVRRLKRTKPFELVQ